MFPSIHSIQEDIYPQLTQEALRGPFNTKGQITGQEANCQSFLLNDKLFFFAYGQPSFWQVSTFVFCPKAILKLISCND